MTGSRSSLRSISAAMLGVIVVLGACSQGGETSGQGLRCRLTGKPRHLQLQLLAPSRRQGPT